MPVLAQSWLATLATSHIPLPCLTLSLTEWTRADDYCFLLTHQVTKQNSVNLTYVLPDHGTIHHLLLSYVSIAIYG